MYLGPASETDIPQAAAFLEAQDWGYADSQAGERFVARDGTDEVVGFLRLIDVAEGVYVADVIVREDRRGDGIGADLMRTAMGTRPGPYFLVCHPERRAFYERLGFDSGEKEAWPPGIVEAAIAEEDWDSGHDHLHHHMSRPPSTPQA